jgi:two-component system, NtrC family, response regulator AtoC
LESELFGYEKGAFTGAYRQKPGKFELAQGGTIFLDEIVEISPSLQAKLLQVLQDREFSRLGGNKDIQVDVRVLAATNRNIDEAVQSGQFREDLYYRLNVVTIVVPPLRERKEEIPILVEYFLNKLRKKYNGKVKPLSNRLMEGFQTHFWPGNVRELENIVHRYTVLGSEETILEEFSATKKSPALEKSGSAPSENHRPSLRKVHREAVIEAETEAIRKTLELTKWNRKKAAPLLSISYKALLYKMKQCGISK